MRGVEASIRQRGFRHLAGVDEAGRGAVAGPVVAAAVILKDGLPIPEVTDSKRVPPHRREVLYARIVAEALAVGVGIVGVSIIEARNILQATLLAMERAIRDLKIAPNAVLVDGLRAPHIYLPAFPVPKGDLRCPSIAAASIVAKVTRDRIMAGYHEQYPEYGFNRHKGYGTAAHFEAIATHGLSPIHRKTFAPVRQVPIPFATLEGQS